ncbi:hypothetical protein C7S20_00355 [Christiangramia fulva]|uniref:Sulfotransferase domain-containing protein n=1 Tax=Christiangramia fulva TaxID=2126553 RepID=A0A2R3Z0R9_9FLAO|nr:hypothetical protein [Christiangramia fulva]AVR43846.1 hypothetical protein C7S20_00355 [Christiangramia fulva]
MSGNKIHIGYPKTATTYLQQIIFPQLKNHTYINHAKFRGSGLNDLIWKADRSVNYEKLKKNYNKNNYFISFENLVGPYFQGSIMIDEIPYRLKKIFGDETRILISIRRQDELLKSLWIQYVHQGGTINFKNFITNPISGNNRIDLNAYNYLETYNRYVKVFGKENVKVLPYEFLNYEREKFIKILKDYFQTEDFNFNNRDIRNRSMSGYQIKLLRFFNRFLMSRVSEKYLIPPRIIHQNDLRHKWQKSNFLRVGNTFEAEDLKLSNSILKMYMHSNKELDTIVKLGLSKFEYY